MIFIFSISVSFGQKADSLFYAQNSRINGKYIGSYFTEFGKAALSPIGWSGGEWITFGGFAATEGILMNFDNDIQNWFPHKSNSKDFFYSTNKYFFDPLGKGLISLPLLGGCFLYGIPTNNDRLQFTALTAVKSWTISVVYAYAFKFLTHRERPQGVGFYDSNNWGGPSFDISDDQHSFPSGHSVSVFAIATVFASEYSDYPWVGWVSYGLAGATALSRIYDNEHWASDVVAGSILGFAIGKTVWNHARNPKIKKHKTALSPWIIPQGGGISFAIWF